MSEICGLFWITFGNIPIPENGSKHSSVRANQTPQVTHLVWSTIPSMINKADELRRQLQTEYSPLVWNSILRIYGPKAIITIPINKSELFEINENRTIYPERVCISQSSTRILENNLIIIGRFRFLRWGGFWPHPLLCNRTSRVQFRWSSDFCKQTLKVSFWGLPLTCDHDFHMQVKVYLNLSNIVILKVWNSLNVKLSSL